MKYEGFVAVAPPADRVALRLKSGLLWILVFFLFTLPLVEAPKNLAAVLYVLVWAAYALRTRDIGGRWNRYDTAFAAMLGSAAVSSAAGYVGDIAGVFRVVFLSWLISRSPLDERDFRVLAAAACVGLLLAIPPGAVPFLLGRQQFLELPSVGHVNQSALYMAILAAAASGWWFQKARTSEPNRARTGFAVCATVFWAALLVSASRAAILGAAVGVLGTLVAVVWTVRHPDVRKLLTRGAAAVGILVVLVAALTAWAPNLSDRKLTPEKIVETSSMGMRMQHWRIAYEGWREHPWLGWGPDAFQQLKVEDVCAWRAQRGENCQPELYMATKHAHSLYLATLAERGLLGVLALAIFAAIWAWSLVRSAGSVGRSALWPASAAGLAVVLVGGFFNTTLRVEHGSLAVGFFALWIAAHGRPQRSRS